MDGAVGRKVLEGESVVGDRGFVGGNNGETGEVVFGPFVGEVVELIVGVVQEVHEVVEEMSMGVSKVTYFGFPPSCSLGCWSWWSC